MKELGMVLPEGVLPVKEKRLAIDLEGGKTITVPLSDMQLETVLLALGLDFEASIYDEYSDEYLHDDIYPAIDTMDAYEAAKRLDITPQRVRRLCAKGSLKCEKDGRDWLISRRSVEARKKNPPRPGKPRTAFDQSYDVYMMGKGGSGRGEFIKTVADFEAVKLLAKEYGGVFVHGDIDEIDFVQFGD